ncbi:MAG: hypothetical protein ABIP39_05715 [Polyangiaceae bacterium]
MLFNSTYRRTIAIAGLSVLGSVFAFSAGATVGAKLDHGARHVSIARMPMPTIQAPEEAPAPPTEVARK